MPDEIDSANDLAELFANSSIQAARKAALNIPPGKPGDCAYCGEYFVRTVNGLCGRCRDKHDKK